MSRYQRPREEGQEPRVTTLELFYDLVFVFAVTQVSHHLLEHLTWAGVGESVLILLVVWWSWNYTTWVTNELDPEAMGVRLLLIGLMLLSLLMAIAIPEAFGDRALLFAGAYVAIQVGRHTFLTFLSGSRGSLERGRAARILVWFLVAGALWIGGALADGSTRTALWVVALAIDYAGPLAVFWIPGLARLPGAAWEITTAHFAERFGLFVILALGETIVITGATTSELELTLSRAVAVAVALLATAAMWWLYFTYVARIAERRLELAANRIGTARDAYTYLHVVLVAGILVAAVGDELIIAHPDDVLPGREVAAVVAGPALYLLSLVLFRLRLTGTVSWRRLGGALACLALAALGGVVSGLVLGTLVLAVLVAVIAGDELAAAARRRRGEAAPLEQLEASVAGGR